MFKKLTPFIVTAIISSLVTFFTVDYFSKRSSDQLINKLSDDLANSRALTVGLSDTLTVAQEDNRGSEKRIGELEARYNDYYKRTEKQQSEIAAGLGQIASNLSKNTDSVESVRIGLESIKDFIKPLP